MSMQEKIMRELHVKPSIDPKQEIEDRVNFLKQYVKKTGAKGFVLGISGGKDSTLAEDSLSLRWRAFARRAETLNLSRSVFRMAHSRMKTMPSLL